MNISCLEYQYTNIFPIRYPYEFFLNSLPKLRYEILRMSNNGQERVLWEVNELLLLCNNLGYRVKLETKLISFYYDIKKISCGNFFNLLHKLITQHLHGKGTEGNQPVKVHLMKIQKTAYQTLNSAIILVCNHLMRYRKTND